MYQKIVPATVLISCLFAPGAWALNTVTFQGEVSTQTCSVNINGDTNSVVMLPTVSVADFSATTGKAVGLTPFTISVTGCAPGASGGTEIKTKFLGHSVDSTTGVLGNVADASTTTVAGNVGIQITGKSDGTNPVTLNGPTAVAGLVLPESQTSATYSFGAQYYSLSTSVTAGAVTAVAEYTLSYL